MRAFKTFHIGLSDFMAVQVDLTVETEPMDETDRPMPVHEIPQRTGAFADHGISARNIRKPR